MTISERATTTIVHIQFLFSFVKSHSTYLLRLEYTYLSTAVCVFIVCKQLVRLIPNDYVVLIRLDLIS